MIMRSATRTIVVTPGKNVGTALAGLGAGLIILAVLFHQEIAAAVAVWIASTAYNHCFLVLPIAAYLMWDRRDTLRDLTIKPQPLFTLAAIPLAVAWLAAERLGIMEGRQLVAMSFVQLLFLSVLGWRAWWAMSGPLLYLYFLVPFGAFLVPKLQIFTTEFVQFGLNLLGIPNYINGFTIQIPQGTFFIAEACAGLRFLIASIAFGGLYALLMYRSPLRRGVFLLASIIVPVIANGLRALGIVVLGNLLGSARAAATDHVLYGWLFFSIVTLILIGLGLPFRQDHRAPRAPRTRPVFNPPGPGVVRGAWITTAIVCAIATVSPAMATSLQSFDASSAGKLPVVALAPGCTVLTTAGHGPASSDRQISCNGLVLRLRMAVLSPHATAAPVFAAERRMIGALRAEGYQLTWPRSASGQARIWQLAQGTNGKRIAVSLWIDGRPTQPSLKQRLHLAWTSLVGARLPPVVVSLMPQVAWRDLPGLQRQLTQQKFDRLLQTWPELTWKASNAAAGGSR